MERDQGSGATNQATGTIKSDESEADNHGDNAEEDMMSEEEATSEHEDDPDLVVMVAGSQMLLPVDIATTFCHGYRWNENDDVASPPVNVLVPTKPWGIRTPVGLAT